MGNRTLTLNGVEVPRFLYGTAWKEEKTSRLAELALRSGFRGIDTANQRRHYFEAAVGEAIQASRHDQPLPRDELFLQTKFTFRRGQDHRLPYDPEAPIPTQVEQSFVNSLEHLGTNYIDSYLLHGPSSTSGLSAVDWAAWRAIEGLRDSGRVRLIGVSNFNLAQLKTLCEDARIQPSFVQNRCYAARGWDLQVREYCLAQGIVYQGFSLLTANRRALASKAITEIAASQQRTVPQVVFRFALEVGMIPITGTSNVEHMQEDLAVFDFGLDSKEVERIQELVR